ncbi:MAG: hypothetical protein KKF57_08055 [Firmicutes bacterium]|nr:hypothetical protein [Bacillota bacterium]
MLKTVKGKVIAGTVTAVLVSGAGVAFGASNAGDKLEAWYDGQFGQASSNIERDVAANVNSRINGLATEYNGLKSAAGTSISTDGTSAYTTASGNIDTKTQEHINSIAAQQLQIEGYMDDQFARLSSFADGLINQAGNTALGYANRDLTSYTGTKGEAARASLTTELGTDTSEAVGELQQAISDAKGDLQDQLDSLEAATTEDIIAAIDAKIEDLRTIITQKRDDLVAAQKLLIDAKALELENAAKDALQEVVDGI